MEQRPRKVSDVVAAVPWLGPTTDALGWLANLLRSEGTNLITASGAELERGTPVYVEADADVIEVQRLMARNHIRRLPVLHDGSLLGVVDLVELALLDEVDQASS